jgi:formylglycine-generating enzyme
MRIILRINLSMVVVACLLLGFSLAAILLLATRGRGAGDSAKVGKTINPADLPEVSAEKAVKSQISEMSSPADVQVRQPRRSSKPLHYRNPKDGYEMILIPRGVAIFGTGPDDPYFEESSTDREKPQFKADIPEFYIGIYCVTNEQYYTFIKETGHRPPEQATWGTPVWKNGKFPEGKGKHPVVCVTWDDAKAYCEWAGLRLPTELQWEKAARGFDGRLFPWGNDWDENKCRNFNNKGLGTTCAVDDYPEGTSIFGVFNMSGNVWEWVEDWYESNAYARYAKNYLTLPNAGQFKLLRGGSWHGDNPVPFRGAARLPKNPDDRASVVGFRCVRFVKGR